MSDNSKKYSGFAIAGFFVPFFTLGFMRILGIVAIVIPIIGLILSIIGIVDANKNEKGGLIFGILGINLSIAVIVVVLTIASMLAKAQQYG